jgi:hypothetical protein
MTAMTRMSERVALRSLGVAYQLVDGVLSKTLVITSP